MEIEKYKQMQKEQCYHWWYIGREKIIKNTLNHLQLKESKILEIGSGMGSNIKTLKCFGSVTALEKEKIAINELKKIIDINVVEGEFPSQCLQEKLKDYNIVAMFDVLEHIENDELALKRLYQGLSANSKVIITVPAYDFLFSQHDILCHHYRRYTTKELKKKFEQAGFNKIYISYFNSLLFPLAIISRTIAKIKGETLGLEKNMPSWLNNLLLKVFSIEGKILPYKVFPFGLSIIAVYEKN